MEEVRSKRRRRIFGSETDCSFFILTFAIILKDVRFDASKTLKENLEDLEGNLMCQNHFMT